VFLINSCSQLVSSTDFSSTSKSLHLHISVPSPEVTAPFCLVPSPEFSQAPWYSLPDHLCRFGVRAARTSRRGFSWQHRITLLPAFAVTVRSQAHEMRICLHLALHPWTWTTIATRRLPSCVTPVNTLTYYRFGSRARRRHPPKRVPPLRALSITGFGMGGSSPVREYQPVVHRLRLSASP